MFPEMKCGVAAIFCNVPVAFPLQQRLVADLRLLVASDFLQSTGIETGALFSFGRTIA
jgi:hypothetical protein